MTHGGVVVGWQPWSNRTLGLGLRGLVGLGSGTPTELIALADRNRRNPVREIRNASSGFVVAEPQADLLVRLTKHLHLDIGGGYRLVNASRVASNRFSGVSGSIALRIGSAQ